MNNKELENFRTRFHNNLMEGFVLNYQLELKDYHNILEKTICETKSNEESSKKIYIYIGSFKKAVNGQICLTYNNDPDSNFKLYKDIETEEEEQVEYKVAKVFEKKNRVIFPVIGEYKTEEYDEAYKNLRFLYYSNLLYSDENSAYRIVKKLTPNK